MKHIVTNEDQIVGPWMMERLDAGHWFKGRGSTIALVDDEKGIVAATMYESCNGASIIMHCAGDGRDWLNKEFLWFAFYYPFEQLGVKVILSPVEEGNHDCIKFIEHLGFNCEATLPEASPNGNLYIYSLRKQDCRWLALKEETGGKTFGPSTA